MCLCHRRQCMISPLIVATVEHLLVPPICACVMLVVSIVSLSVCDVLVLSTLVGVVLA